LNEASRLAPGAQVQSEEREKGAVQKQAAPTRNLKRRSSNGSRSSYCRRLEAKPPTIWMGLAAHVPSRDGMAFPVRPYARRPTGAESACLQPGPSPTAQRPGRAWPAADTGPSSDKVPTFRKA